MDEKVVTAVVHQTGSHKPQVPVKTPGATKRKPSPSLFGVKKRRRTKEDFLDFITIVMKYTQYQPEESNNNAKDAKTAEFDRSSISPLGSSSDSNSVENAEEYRAQAVPTANSCDQSEDEAITCFCGKPFGGRPMIECGSCKTWIHLSCAKIRRTHIPEVYICNKCRDATQTARKSTRVRTENKKFTEDAA